MAGWCHQANKRNGVITRLNYRILYEKEVGRYLASKAAATYTHQYFGAIYLLDQLAGQVGVKQDLKTCFGELAK
ncbi:hypothetical protein CHT97_12270 [Lacticaseibacillus chiayiensis]|nr:hypothetical protein CHT97_12270 [Lacticaseibacillus chiayiensis]